MPRGSLNHDHTLRRPLHSVELSGFAPRTHGNATASGRARAAPAPAPILARLPLQPPPSRGSGVNRYFPTPFSPYSGCQSGALLLDPTRLGRVYDRRTRAQLSTLCRARRAANPHTRFVPCGLGGDSEGLWLSFNKKNPESASYFEGEGPPLFARVGFHENN